MSKEDEMQQRQEQEIARIKLPRSPEIFGIVEVMVGGDKMKVKCLDGNMRLCRIPGRLRKKVWIRINDLVLVEPWITQSNERADIVFRYTPTQANWLRRKGLIK